MQSEKSGDEALTALGALSNLSLKSRIRSGGNAFAAGYNMFVDILIPKGRPGLTGAGIVTVPVGADTLYFKTSSANWQTFTGGEMPAYISNVAANQVDSIALEVLQNTDLSNLRGAKFYVGYGTSAEEMIAKERYRILYQVP